MNKIKYEIIEPTKDVITTLEAIRFNAYELDPTKLSPEKTFYATELKNKKYLVFGCFYNNQLVGACYVSKQYNSLYIEQIFILKKYQKSKMHLGTNLLKYVLNNQKIIEAYFNTKFNFSYLDNYKDTTNFYEALGYKISNSQMKKRL